MTTLDIVDLDTARWVRQYEWHLDQIPAILHTLRDEAVPLKAARLDNIRVSGSREQAPLPFNADMVDAGDDLWAALAQYLGHVAELLGETVTDAASWTRRGEAVGLSSHIRGREALALAYRVIAWLIDHARQVAAFTVLQDTEDHLFALIRKLRTRYMIPAVERPARRRQCTTCGEQAVTAAWVDGINARPVLVATCRRCGATYGEPPAAS